MADRAHQAGPHLGRRRTVGWDQAAAGSTTTCSWPHPNKIPGFQPLVESGWQDGL